MSILDEDFTLANGVKIPKLGFGTWLIHNEEVKEPTKAALASGYRHIDSAEVYGNEEGIGQALKEYGVNRKDIFITTKLSASIKDYDEAVKAIDESLRKLDMDYVDLMLIHAPRPWNEEDSDNHYFKENLEAWRALEDAHKAGKIRAIGVSNFDQEDLANILEHSSVKPVVNQIEAYISNTPFDVIDYCKDHDILVEAYSPIAHGKILQSKDLQDMAKKYDVSVAQLCVKYCLQLDLLPLPKSVNPDHIKADTELDFTISDADMATLKSLKNIEE